MLAAGFNPQGMAAAAVNTEAFNLFILSSQ
jgi:hypothetical protein